MADNEKLARWSETSEWDKRELATNLVAMLLYPPLRAGGSNQQADREWRRTKAVSTLLANDVAEHLDRLMSIVLKGDLARYKAEIDELAAPIVDKWQPDWITRLYRAGSPNFYNIKKPKEVWSDLRHLYLIAVALIRQRNEVTRGGTGIEEPGLRRAIWVVVKTYPKDCEYVRAPKGLQDVVSKFEPVWPLACGLLHAIATAAAKRSNSLRSLHDLVPSAIPRTRSLIAAFLADPGEVLSASRFFQEQLSMAGRVSRQEAAPLNASRCIQLPQYPDLQRPLSCPEYLTGLTEKEADQAHSYTAMAYDELRVVKGEIVDRLTQSKKR